MPKALVETMDKLVELHEGLYGIASRKTQSLIYSKRDELQQLVKKEQAFLLEISELNQQRQKQAASLVPVKPGAGVPTLQEIIDETECELMKKELELLKTRLTEAVMKLSEQNNLNRELTHQSLQLVSTMLNSMLPKQTPFNYSNPQHNHNSALPVTSLFDSKT
ncbi:flagellar protein FlgN [Jeotgalibacillus sp. S-D1]|uniref:flagellar protein FlgN n=1 Tax=Jeotgalibacillus sp. S-D1 TaxID=2552189 RepID=UPI0010597CFC|nr:flagellar protein FlgN [Jeotgalibacillus sp. S-D1]TDL32587.1 flagellar protein FlgN [Jeotgalibacillus sp. S-D1]